MTMKRKLIDELYEMMEKYPVFRQTYQTLINSLEEPAGNFEPFEIEVEPLENYIDLIVKNILERALNERKEIVNMIMKSAIIKAEDKEET